MKKFGFTLSELVVAVSIIGVAAALFVPVAGKLVPDTKKASVLKYYVEINNAVHEFYNNEDLYQPNDECNGLSCINPENPNYNNFGDFLTAELGLDNNVASDGMGITINPNDRGYRITLDTNVNNNSVNFYDAANENIGNVDSFRFILNEDGNISAGDALTDAYLQNQYNWQAKSDDINKAKALLEKKKSY